MIRPLVLAALLVAASPAFAADAAKPPDEPKDAVMGLYAGTFSPSTSKAVAQLEADVIDLGRADTGPCCTS